MDKYILLFIRIEPLYSLAENGMDAQSATTEITF
jgi:hypothetical protein